MAGGGRAGQCGLQVADVGAGQGEGEGVEHGGERHHGECGSTGAVPDRPAGQAAAKGVGRSWTLPPSSHPGGRRGPGKQARQRRARDELGEAARHLRPVRAARSAGTRRPRRVAYRRRAPPRPADLPFTPRPVAMRRRMPAPGRSAATVITRSTVVCRATTWRWVSVAARSAGGGFACVGRRGSRAIREAAAGRGAPATLVQRAGHGAAGRLDAGDHPVEARDRLVEPLEGVVEVLQRRRELADKPRVLFEQVLHPAGLCVGGPTRSPTTGIAPTAEGTREAPAFSPRVLPNPSTRRCRCAGPGRTGRQRGGNRHIAGLRFGYPSVITE